MSVREYIGARYVPLFADPLEWDATRTYEPLTVVLYQGNSYTSRQAVPANIPITNTTYWAQTGNYNAQIEQYRSEVQTFDGRITANATAIANETTARQEAVSNETTARQNADSALAQDISNEATARQNADATLTQDISNEATARQNADTALGQRITNLENYKPIILLFGDSYCVTGVPDGRGNMYEQLNARLGSKYQILNRSVTGAAFADVNDAQAPYMLQQVNAAIADTSFDHTKVAYCIVVGGRNDGYRGTIAQSVAGVSACGSALRNEFTNAKVVFGIGNWTGQRMTGYASSKFAKMEETAKAVAGCVSTTAMWTALLTGDDTLAPSTTNYHPTPSGMWRLTELIIGACFGGTSMPSGRTGISNPFPGCSDIDIHWQGNMFNYKFTLASNADLGTPQALSDAAARYFSALQRYMSSASVNAGNAPCVLRFNADGTVQAFPASTTVTGVPYNVTTTIC